jgi:hypothetical protein
MSAQRGVRAQGGVSILKAPCLTDEAIVGREEEPGQTVFVRDSTTFMKIMKSGIKSDGPRTFPLCLTQWARARIIPLDQGAAIPPALSARPEAERLAAWRNASEPALIQKPGKSDVPVTQG